MRQFGGDTCLMLPILFTFTGLFYAKSVTIGTIELNDAHGEVSKTTVFVTCSFPHDNVPGQWLRRQQTSLSY